MTTPSRRIALGLGFLTALACGDIAAPVRDDIYEWRLLVPASPSPGVDTLSFHWEQAELPVRVWVEDTVGLPAHMARAIEIWRAEFLYGEFDGTLVSDSTQADVLVRGSAPTSGLPAQRLHSALAPECSGATDLDIDVANHALRLPIRLFIDPGVLPDDPGLERCLALTSIHELGHAIGIFDHSPQPDDIMFMGPQVELPSGRDQRTAEAAYHTPRTLEVVR